MENSTVKADYVWYCDDDIEYDEYSKFQNISDLNNYNLPPNITRDIKYNFGDLVAFSDYRDTGTYIIGKGGKLIANPDFSGAGYLTIPYEITQYLDNAVEKYSDVEPNCIELRHDDKFVKDNINTKSMEILEKWKWKIIWYYDGDFSIEFPDKSSKSFDSKTTSVYKIKKWYESSKLEQTVLKLNFEVKDELYDLFKEKYGSKDKPDIPVTWNVEYGTSGGGHKHSHRNYRFKGPLIEKERIMKKINKFYKGFNFKLSEL